MKSPAFLTGTRLALAALALGGGAPAWADVKDGVDAWSRGDYAAAVREWQPLADKGDADARFNLAQAYKLGRGVSQDFAQAEILYAKAAQQGHLAAADNYGLLLFQRGQQAAAMPYIRAAADRGDARAQYLLGLAYFNAELVGKDWVRAYALESLASQPSNGAPGLPQAREALTQMDKYIPIEDRQRAISLATEMAAQIEANRNRQLAAFDLGTKINPVAPSGIAGTMAPARVEPAPPPRRAAPVPVAPPAPMSEPPVAEPAPMPMRRPAAAPTSGGSWKIQFGAFGQPANADALWAKVKSMSEVSGHARQNVATGRVTRLLATGYSEDGARTACSRLAASGVPCIAVRD